MTAAAGQPDACPMGSVAADRPVAIRCCATLGDSITSGTGAHPCTLWPELVFRWLDSHLTSVRHIEFAVDGATSSDVIEHQVPRALAAEPDLITVICGANDVLRDPRPDIDLAAKNLDEALRIISKGLPSAHVVTATYPDFVPFLPWRPRSKARVSSGMAELNKQIRLVASERDVLCVDLGAASRRYSEGAFAPDGVHPSEVGHHRIAIGMTRALAETLRLPDPDSYWGIGGMTRRQVKAGSSQDGGALGVLEKTEHHGLPALGSRFGSRGRTITESDVTMFAALTGDRHPQHTDAEWARNSMFGERIAHGLLVLSFALGLGDLDASRVIALRRLRNVVFKRPTRFGDTIRAEVTVASAHMVAEGTGLVGLDWVVSNARGGTLVRASMDVLWRTDSAPSQTSREFYGDDLDLPDGFVPC